jgi:hypothetical protein
MRFDVLMHKTALMDFAERRCDADSEAQKAFHFHRCA